MNNKGFADIGLVIAVLLIFSLFIIIGLKVLDSYNEKWQDQDSVNANAKTLVSDLDNRYSGLFDGIFMFVFALLVIALFISVLAIGTRPEFFFITVILLVILIGVGALMSNVFEDSSTSQGLNNTTQQFTFIPFIMSNMPFVVLLAGLLIMGGLYIKIKG